MRIFHDINNFFFRRIPANAFGMMRIGWAFMTTLWLLFQWKDISYYYSQNGIFPPHLEHMFVRQEWRFTILDYVTTPLAVHCLFLILIILLLCSMLGIKTRISTILSVLLIFSFHERNSNILGGGDTMLRCIGFILMIAPGITALSLDRAAEGWTLWKKTRERLAQVTMPIWPWRLLLWQLIVLYTTSFWTKMLGDMWMDGTAVQVTFHHPMFARFPGWLMEAVYPSSLYFDRIALVWQASWILLLVPAWATSLLPFFVPRIPLRRILMIFGVFFHLGILILMDAGSFSCFMFVAYLGLLREDDIQWLKKFISSKKKITILFDGQCGLCMRSMYVLELCDWLHILQRVDFRNANDRKIYAPGITEGTLDKAMHIRLADGSYLTGFDAFRYMTKKLPPLWPLWPILWIPGVAPIGRVVYARVAERRKTCTHEECVL